MKKISQYIKNQFPAVYQDLGDDFVTFIEAYYEYMDVHHSANRDNLSNIDIDKTLNEYVSFFKRTYLKNFPVTQASDPRFAIKHIKDFYSSKGTELSTELLLKIMFGDNAKIYYPGSDVFKPSDSKWFQPIYLEVTSSPKNYTLIDKQITGAKSGAKAIVEGVVTKRINGKYIDVIFISSLRGNFLTSEVVSSDGILKGSPTVIGSLTEIDIVDGGRNNKIGDVFDVISSNGKQGKARVSEITNSTGRVDFDIINGGSGYTKTADTSVYISSGVLFLKNESQLFIDFERIEQKLETLDLISVDNMDMELGHTFHGVNENGLKVAEGTIVDVSSSVDVNGNAIAKTKLLVTSGTFDNQRRLVCNSDTSFLAEETIEEESTVTIEIGSVVGTPSVGNKVEQIKTADYGSLRATINFNSLSGVFQVGETIYQNNAGNQLAATGKIVKIASNSLEVKALHFFNGETAFSISRTITGTNSGATANVTAYIPSPTATVYTDYAFGTIQSISGNSITLKPAWGNFEIGTGLKFLNGTTQVATSTSDAIDYVSVGARGTFTSKPAANTYVIQNIFGDFTASNKIRGSKSFKITTINSNLNEGATDVWYDGVSTANGVIDLIANTTASGIVIGQNTTSIGVYGNNYPFISSGEINLDDTFRLVSSITSHTGNSVNVNFTSPHMFLQGDTVNVKIDMQHMNEVKYIRDLMTVNSVPNSSTIRLTLDQEFSDIIRSGQFSLFDSSCEKTVVVNVSTSRNEMLEPPRNSSGDIIELSIPVIEISTGYGASFDIGELENTETVFLNTDIIGGNNIIGAAYTGIRIDGSNSGIGFIDGVIVNSGGNGYSNGQVITFNGGGYANGDPIEIASGIISTTPGGAISTVTMNAHGQGYWVTPTIVYPGVNASANLEVSADFGYGFPKSPNGDENTMLQDLWTSEEFTLGTIGSLSNINPGREYNANPFVRVYNSYVAGFGRTDFLLTVGAGAASYAIGETLTQTIGGSGGPAEYAKGYVLATASDSIIVRRISFNTAFTENYPLVGSQSGISLNVISAKIIEEARVMGDNANISAIVISADGIVTKLDIIDSGYGYENGDSVKLTSSEKPFIVTGISKLKNQGKGEGFWKTFTSHVDHSSKIHDNDYYQEFSYEIVSGQSIDQYKTVLQEIMHVAGNKMFGKVEKESVLQLQSSQIDGLIDVT